MDTETAQTATPVAETTSETPSEYQLKASDRCDRCAAQAFVIVYMKDNMELWFCGHHYSHNEASLAPFVVSISDQRNKLNPKPSPSASI